MKVRTRSLSPSQCRAARALLEWSRMDLAKAADVSDRTIIDFERGARQPQARTLERLRAALEGAGVRIIDGGKLGPGARLEKP